MSNTMATAAEAVHDGMVVVVRHAGHLEEPVARDEPAGFLRVLRLAEVEGKEVARADVVQRRVARHDPPGDRAMGCRG